MSHIHAFRITEEEHCFWQPKVGTARTPRNDPAWPRIDKDLLPAARGDCVEALQNTSEVVGEGVIKMVRGDRQKVCEIYGEEFIATRRDVKMCATGCKQKAYWQRKEEVQQNQ